MTESTPDASPSAGPPDDATEVGSGRFKVGALVAIAVALGLLLWLVLRDSDDSSSTASAPVAMTAAELEEFASSLGHPVYWLGPKEGYTYELERTSEGTIFIRYLPAGVAVGSTDPQPTVATYPFPSSLAALEEVAKQSGSTKLTVAGGGLAVATAGRPESVHVAYPDVDYQVEVFDPAGRAIDPVRRGEVAAVGDDRQAAPTSRLRLMSRAELAAYAASLGQPVYWAGEMADRRYEVLRTPDGQVLIRYLPPGAKVGADGAYLTVATYPFAGAYEAMQGLANEQGVETIELPGGGLATVSEGNPRSIHLAFPGSDYQVEVFDPSAARAREIVSSGKIATVG